MKNILKISLYIIFGLAAGSVATGFLMNRFHRQQMAEIYAMELGSNALTALMLREGNVEIVTQSYENNLPGYVLAISRDSELRKANMADIALSSTKRFYVCTKTEIPQEIAEIMEKVTAMPCNVFDE